MSEQIRQDHLQLSLQMGDLLICLNSVLTSLLEACQLLLEVCQLASPLAGCCLLQRQRLLSLAKPAPQPDRAAPAWHLRTCLSAAKAIGCHAAGSHAPEAAKTALESL